MLEEGLARQVVEPNRDALRKRELDRRPLPADGEVNGVEVDGEERSIWIELDGEVGWKTVVLIGEVATETSAHAAAGGEERRGNAPDNR